MITWYGVNPRAAAEACSARPRAASRSKRCTMSLQDAWCRSRRGGSGTARCRACPRGRSIPAARRPSAPRRSPPPSRSHPRRGRAGRRPAAATSRSVKPGAHVDRVDVRARGQDRPHLGEGQVLVQRVAPREHGRRAVEDVGDLEGQRAADDVLWLSATTTELVDSPCVHRDHDLGALGTERVRLELVPEDEGEDEHEQAAGHDGQRSAGAGGPRAARAARRSLRVPLSGGPPSASSSTPSSAGAVGLGLGSGPRQLVGVGVAVAVARSPGPVGPLTPGPATPAAAPWPPRCRPPCGPPCPVRPAARSERSASTVVKRSSAVSTRTPERLEQRRAARRPPRAPPAPPGPTSPERLSGSPTTTVDASTSRTASTTAPAVRARRHRCARIVPHGLARRPPAVAVGHADALGPEVERRPPGPGRSGAHRRARGQESLRLGQRRLDLRRDPSRPPAPPRPSRRRRRRRSRPASCTSCVASGEPPVAAAIATFVPSGDPPSTTARTPSWRSTAWASDLQVVGLDVVAPRHHHPAVGRRRLGQRPGLRLARLLAQPRPAPARRRAGAPSRRPIAASSSSGSVRSSSAADSHQALALEGTIERRVAGQREDPPRVRADRSLRQQGDRADLTQRVDVGPAAELERGRPRLHHAHRRRRTCRRRRRWRPSARPPRARSRWSRPARR